MEHKEYKNIIVGKLGDELRIIKQTEEWVLVAMREHDPELTFFVKPWNIIKSKDGITEYVTLHKDYPVQLSFSYLNKRTRKFVRVQTKEKYGPKEIKILLTGDYDSFPEIRDLLERFWKDDELPF